MRLGASNDATGRHRASVEFSLSPITHRAQPDADRRDAGRIAHLAGLV